MIANKARLTFLLALLILSLAACGEDQPNRYQTKVWVILDEQCNANPWGFPVPEVTP